MDKIWDQIERLVKESNGMITTAQVEADGISPVSYTHLDVYKRQRQYNVPLFPFFRCFRKVLPQVRKRRQDVKSYNSLRPLVSMMFFIIDKAFSLFLTSSKELLTII